MTALIFRHLCGGKAQQEVVFTAADFDRPLTIGRDASNPLSFTDADAAASRYHARVVRTVAGFSLVDLGSANGLYRNGVHVTRSAELQHGDVLRFGQGGPELSLHFDPPPAGASLPPPLQAAALTAGDQAAALGAPFGATPAKQRRVGEDLGRGMGRRLRAVRAAAAGIAGRAGIAGTAGIAGIASIAGVALVIAVSAWPFDQGSVEPRRLSHWDTPVRDRYATATERLSELLQSVAQPNREKTLARGGAQGGRFRAQGRS